MKLTARGDARIHVLIDINEKYPWKFQECVVDRKALPAGDYALLRDEGIAAVVERKTFENLRSNFNDIAILHQKLGELEAYAHSALVVEANYSDFLNPKKLTVYTPTYAAKVLAELSALHPGTRIVFAGKRKLANEWTLRFFQAIESHERDALPEKVAEIAEEYGSPPDFKGGIYYDIREYILDESISELTSAELKDRFPDAPDSTIKRVLRALKKEGLITSMGRGKKADGLKFEYYHLPLGSGPKY